MIYVNGDSYSERTKLGGAWSDYLDQETHNSAIQGSSNDRIIRTTLEDVLTIKPKKVIIGFSFFTRDEVWWDGKLVTLDSLKDNNTAWNEMKDKIVDMNINHQVIHNYTKIHMLAQTLKNLKIDYLFFSAANNEDFRKLDWNYLRSLNIYNEITTDPNIIDLHSFNIPKWGGENGCDLTETGHFANLDGHKKFGQYIKELL